MLFYSQLVHHSPPPLSVSLCLPPSSTHSAHSLRHSLTHGLLTHCVSLCLSTCARASLHKHGEGAFFFLFFSSFLFLDFFFFAQQLRSAFFRPFIRQSISKIAKSTASRRRKMFKHMRSSFVYALAVCGSLPSGASAGPAALRAAYHRPAAAVSQEVNDRPIIGILTQPVGTERNTTGEGAYIAASYVKFVEMSGARAVPVFHFDSKENLTKTFQSVNGLLFPGGGSNISAGSDLHSAGQILLDLALNANDNGDEFPIWGTCMGFQFLSILAAGSEDVLCEECFTTEGVPLALNFTAAAHESYLFSDLQAHRPDL